MSVSCTEYLAYMIDVTDEYDELDKEIFEKWHSDFKGTHKEEFNKFNFAPVYGGREYNVKGKITLLYDGLNGEYCKLMHVIEYGDCEYGEENTDLIDKLNVFLALGNVEPSVDVKNNIANVYKEIFGKDLDSKDRIILQYFKHWS